MMSSPLLQDRVILVTGAATGIGEAIARRCAAEGARVMITDRDGAGAQRVAGSIGAASVVEDLTDPDAPERIMAATIATYGRLDGLVNNAALTTRSNLETTTAALFDQLVAVNLRAPLLLIKAAHPHFLTTGGGAVVNIGSINAYCGEPELLVYSITKGGLMTMTRNLADAHAHERIRINQINAGWTATANEIQLKKSQGMPEGWERNLPVHFAPFGRIFTPEEVAGHVAFWLSEASGPFNGSVVELEQYPMLGRNPKKES